VENSALDLRWILNLITALQKSANVNSSVTLALLPSKTNIVRIRSSFFPLWHLTLLQRLHHAYIERVFSVCSDMCAGKRKRISINLEQHFFANEQEILGRCTTVG